MTVQYDREIFNAHSETDPSTAQDQKLEGMHRFQTHTVLLYSNPNFDL